MYTFVMWVFKYICVFKPRDLSEKRGNCHSAIRGISYNIKNLYKGFLSPHPRVFTVSLELSCKELGPSGSGLLVEFSTQEDVHAPVSISLMVCVALGWKTAWDGSPIS